MINDFNRSNDTHYLFCFQYKHEEEDGDFPHWYGYHHGMTTIYSTLRTFYKYIYCAQHCKEGRGTVI